MPTEKKSGRCACPKVESGKGEEFFSKGQAPGGKAWELPRTVRLQGC